MLPESSKLLLDIRQALDDIVRFIAGKTSHPTKQTPCAALP
jgi:hypothetical protein